jgi:hypothetical protein
MFETKLDEHVAFESFLLPQLIQGNRSLSTSTRARRGRPNIFGPGAAVVLRPRHLSARSYSLEIKIADASHPNICFVIDNQIDLQCSFL